ncbi:MAG: hypothetical protein IPM74_18580 [Crocinitomicaceae bacterium]|nr:hypothetical protein [Crocinitomicaceae bacterium]MBK8927848.1 hypothetical protein [Crocinitomicaceae bacterium]
MNSPNNYNILSFQIFKKKKIYIFLLFALVINKIFAQDINNNGYNIFYFPGGAVASEGMFVNGKPEGVWKAYYETGVLKSIGKKRAGLSDSTWVFYDEQGRKTTQYEYVNDKKNGCAVKFDTLGLVVVEMFYVNDVLQGEQMWYYPNGNIKKTIQFADGQETGLAVEYNTAGNIITEEIYDHGYLKKREEYNRLNEYGEKTGVWREYYGDGTIKSETAYRNGQKSGIEKLYNPKGKLISMQDMTSDSTSTISDIGLIELYKEYYPGGKTKLIGGMTNGLKNGIFREYSEDGTLVNGYLYEQDTLVAEGMILYDGTRTGQWTFYYRSQKIKCTGTYNNGVKEDAWVYYYENGKKEQEGKYRKDIPFGMWNWYYPNGQLGRTETYNAYGLLEGMMTEFDSVGNEIARGEYYAGLQEGEWFYQVGDHKEVGSFTVGQPNGLWIHYYLNGKIAFTGQFEEGTPKGKHTWYHQNGIKKMSGKYVGGVKHGFWRTYDQMGEKTEEIIYKNGEIIKINGFKVTPVEVLNL